MSIVKFVLEDFWALNFLAFFISVGLLKIVIVEIVVEVFMVIDPGLDHVRVLLVEVDVCGSSMHQNRAVESNVVCV